MRSRVKGQRVNQTRLKRSTSVLSLSPLCCGGIIWGLGTFRSCCVVDVHLVCVKRSGWHPGPNWSGSLSCLPPPLLLLISVANPGLGRPQEVSKRWSYGTEFVQINKSKKPWKDFCASFSKLNLKMALPKVFHRALDPRDVDRHYLEKKDVTCPKNMEPLEWTKFEASCFAAELLRALNV